MFQSHRVPLAVPCGDLGLCHHIGSKLALARPPREQSSVPKSPGTADCPLWKSVFFVTALVLHCACVNTQRTSAPKSSGTADCTGSALVPV